MPIYKDKVKTSDGRQYYFVVNYVDTAGKKKNYKSKRFLTKKEASEQEALYRVSMGKSLPTKDTTFSIVIDQYLKEKEETLKPMSLRDLKIVCECIREPLGSVSVSALTTTQFVAFRSSTQSKAVNGKQVSTTYKNKILKQLRAICKFAQIRFGITQNIPFQYGYFTDHNPKEMDYYTYDEFRQFIAYAPNLKFKAFFTTLFMCGTRCGEANALQFKNYDFEKHTISISKTITTKMKVGGEYLITTPKTNGSIRTIPVCTEVSQLIEELWQQSQNPNYFIFGGKTAIAETSIQKAKKKMCKEAGLREIRIHDFRHSFASYVVHTGVCNNILVLSRYIGHSNATETLKVYSHLFTQDLTEMVEKLDKSFLNHS